MTLLEKLEDFIGHPIAIVMEDGYSYKGILKEYDVDIIILTDVEETTNSDVGWKEMLKDKHDPNFILWRKVGLPEVIIRIDKVMRVWPWKEINITGEVTENIPLYELEKDE